MRLAAGLDAITTVLSDHRRELDALNVFPVPDGDTGSNMLATARAARAALDRVHPDEVDSQAAASAVSDGALRGARGNSGVLLSQVLRALLATETDQTGRPAPTDARTDWLRPGIERRLANADALARAAVASPVEGSILTVITAAAHAATISDAEDATARLAAARDAAHEAVAATTGQLDALRRAGVVDAGGRGFALVLEALLAAVTSAPASPPDVHVPDGGPDTSTCDQTGGRYEVMYLLHPTPPAGHEPAAVSSAELDTLAADVRHALTEVGDSVVVVGAAEVVTVHVHTDDIGAAVEVGVVHGRPSGVRVEDLRVGTEVAASRAEHPAGDARLPRAVDPDRPRVALVVGAQGAGLALVAEGLGALVVDLQAGDLPSVEELMQAITASGGERVVLLPGHKDVLPTARQAAQLLADSGGAEVDVVTEAVDPALVLAALSVADPVAPDADQLGDAAGAVRSGSVVAAGRDADTAAGAVRSGEWLAVVAGEAVAVAQNPVAALTALLEHLGGGELVSLLVGADVAQDVARAGHAAVLQASGEHAEVEVVMAGQRPAAFVVGVE